MPDLFINCPNKGRAFSTGFKLERADLEKAAKDKRKFSHCPLCGAVHSWTMSEAFFAADDGAKWGV